MTRRERLERKLEKRQEWAGGHRAKAAGLEAQNERYRGDVAFNTQPGHIPERARAIRRDDKRFEHLETAGYHEQKADGLARQLDRTIFSDDPDARVRLAEKADAIDDRVEYMKSVNAAWRKVGKPDPSDTDGWQKVADVLEADLKTLWDVRQDFARFPYFRQPYPSYAITNARANQRRAGERAKAITRQSERSETAAVNGGVLIEGEGEYCTVTFAEKPARAVLDALKEAGFWWKGGSWFGRRDKIPPSVREVPEGAAP